MQRHIPADEVPFAVKIEIICDEDPQQYIHVWPILVEEADTLGWQILMQRPFIVGPDHQCWDHFKRLIPEPAGTPVAARFKFQKALRDWATNEVRYFDILWSYTFKMIQNQAILATPEYYNSNTIYDVARQ